MIFNYMLLGVDLNLNRDGYALSENLLIFLKNFLEFSLTILIVVCLFSFHFNCCSAEMTENIICVQAQMLYSVPPS